MVDVIFNNSIDIIFLNSNESIGDIWWMRNVPALTTDAIADLTDDSATANGPITEEGLFRADVLMISLLQQVHFLASPHSVMYIKKLFLD
jgi:hypothetical protein